MNQHQTIPSPVGGGLGWGRNTPMPDNAPLPTSPSRGKEYSYRATSPEPRAGFTLVELALVLVILGLIVGGVVVGQDLIRAGGVRSVINEYQTYSGAVSAFKDKYLSIPGDMTNATSFWGDNSTACADGAITNGTPGTCNGDGDGTIEPASAASATGEMYQFWNQLALSGIISGQFSGTAGTGSGIHCVLGTNCPASKFPSGGWALYYDGSTPYVGSANHFSLTYANYFFFGGQHATSIPVTPVLKPADALSIDTKLDDGKPGTGSVIAYYRTTCADSTAVDDYDSAYRASDTTAQCALYFVRQF